MARVIEQYFPRTDYIDGGPGALDQIDGSYLKDSDVALVSTDTYFSPYHCNATGGLGEDSPHIIVPNVNPGPINWELLKGLFKGLTIYDDPSDGDGVGNRDYNDSRYPMVPVINSELADMAENTIKGRVSSGSGDPEDLTATQVRAIINVEDGADVTDATNVESAGAVMNTGDETIAGVKTFSSHPVTPSSAPTADYQVANKKYVDDNEIGAKGWVVMDTTGATIDIHDSFNIDIVVDWGPGEYDIHWSTEFSDQYYSATFGTDGGLFGAIDHTRTTELFLAATCWSIFTDWREDANRFCVTAHGRQ